MELGGQPHPLLFVRVDQPSTQLPELLFDVVPLGQIHEHTKHAKRLAVPHGLPFSHDPALDVVVSDGTELGFIRRSAIHRLGHRPRDPLAIGGMDPAEKRVKRRRTIVRRFPKESATLVRPLHRAARKIPIQRGCGGRLERQFQSFLVSTQLRLGALALRDIAVRVQDRSVPDRDSLDMHEQRTRRTLFGLYLVLDVLDLALFPDLFGHDQFASQQRGNAPHLTHFVGAVAEYHIGVGTDEREAALVIRDEDGVRHAEQCDPVQFLGFSCATAVSVDAMLLSHARRLSTGPRHRTHQNHGIHLQQVESDEPRDKRWHGGAFLLSEWEVAVTLARMTSTSSAIDARIKELGDWRGKMLAKVRKIIHEADPDIVEEWKWQKQSSPGTPVWSHGGIVCTGETYKDAVKMTFAKGASLEDPAGLFNSSLDGNVRRAIDIHEGDTIDEAALKDLIRAAVALNLKRK